MRRADHRLIEGGAEVGAEATDRARFVAALASWRSRTEAEQWLGLGGDEEGNAFAPAIEPARGRIRVGLLCPCLGLGGAESWQLALVRAIDSASLTWRGAVVTEGRRGVTSAMLDRLGRSMPVGFGLEAARTLAANVDVLISWSVVDYDALFAGLARPPRLALACHFPGERPWSETAEALLGRADRLVAVSELAVDSIPARLRGRATVIWNAVDPDRLRPGTDRAATRAAWGVPLGVPVAGYLGRLAPEKDPGAMLRLAEALPEPWHVVVVGDGPEAQNLAGRAASLGLDRVRLVPGTTRAGDVLAAFDNLVVPSRFESFGLTMAEGFAARVPVIAPPVGLARLVPGLTRAVPIEPTGVELAGALVADVLDPEGTRARVERAAQFARDRLSLDRFGADWLHLVRDLAWTSTAPASSRPSGEEAA